MMEFGFALKKLISFFILPKGMFLTFFTIGIILLFLNKQKKAKIFLGVSFALFLILGYPPLANALLSNIENKYQKYEYIHQVKYIHVLGSGHNDDFSQPLSSMIGEGGLKRILEGIIIHNKIKDSKIIFTGFAATASVTTADMNARLSLALGIDKDEMLIDGGPKDTQEEALFMKSIVGDKPFILVTSASHMPRAMILFEGLGLNPVPAPTDFHKSKFNGYFVLPSFNAFSKSNSAMYEYIGTLWVKLRSL